LARAGFLPGFPRAAFGIRVAVTPGAFIRQEYAMTVSHFLRAAALCLTLLFAAAGQVGAKHSTDLVRLTSSANVTIRQTPSADAPAVASVTLGTELVETGPAGMEKTWVHVKLADGREGWVTASLTRPVDADPARRWPVIERIILDRLGRKGDGFPAIVELAEFTERVTGLANPDAEARLDLHRLRAVAAAAGAIPFNQGQREPYRSWLDRHKGLVIYDEPGGGWMLANHGIQMVHDRHATAPAADDIAWLAVTTGLAGECEGAVTCYLASQNQLSGEYLRKHPQGRHAEEAIAGLKDLFDRLATPPKLHAAFEFDRARDCTEFATTLDALRLAIAATQASERDAALQSLATLRTWCR
jgi:hypothetical protein